MWKNDTTFQLLCSRIILRESGRNIRCYSVISITRYKVKLSHLYTNICEHHGCERYKINTFYEFVTYEFKKNVSVVAFVLQ